MIGDKIKELGENFSGLWVSNIDYNYNKQKIVFVKTWSVTFTYGGEYVDTDGQKSPEEALDVALELLEKLKKLKGEKLR